jgi:hypothetical protein
VDHRFFGEVILQIWFIPDHAFLVFGLLNRRLKDEKILLIFTQPGAFIGFSCSLTCAFADSIQLAFLQVRTVTVT